MDENQLPHFATNGLYAGKTVASEVNKMFRIMREQLVVKPPVKIATAYINPEGFSLLADELEQASVVMLLLGAEPDANKEHVVAHSDGDQNQALASVLSNHDAWLKAERDNMGFTLKSTSEAKRMVDWLNTRNEDGHQTVEVRRYGKGFLHGKAYISADASLPATLAGSSNMTFAGLKTNVELNLGFASDPLHTRNVIEWFDHYWELSESYDLAGLYARQWDPHSPWSIFVRMLWELYGSMLGDEKQPVTTLNLTRFQSDGVSRMERLLESLGGVLVADEVGLGKTYQAAEIISRFTEINRQRVLIVSPASLKTSMWEPFIDRYGFRLTKVFSYEEIRNRMSLDDPGHEAFAKQMEEYALIVVDEAHNLRNSNAARSEAIDKIILGGKHPKKVILLTATPVNNSLSDLETLIKYFIRDDAYFASIGIPSIHVYIKEAQSIDPENLTPEHLFDLMDQVAVRRTRKFVMDQYPGESIIGANGLPTTISFPKPCVRRIEYNLSDDGIAFIDRMIRALSTPDNLGNEPQTEDQDGSTEQLVLARYMTSLYLKNEEIESYQLSNAGLLRSALLKRLESSPYALQRTLETLIKAHKTFLGGIGSGYVLIGDALNEWGSSESDDLDEFIAQLDDDKSKQARTASDFDIVKLQHDVECDLLLLESLHEDVCMIASEQNVKVAALVDELNEIASEARRMDPSGLSSEDRRKTIVFSTYSDTVISLHDELSRIIDSAPDSSPLSDYKERIAPPILGAYASVQRAGKSGGVSQEGRAQTIESFAPKTAGPLEGEGKPLTPDRYDLLITTDVLSEGVNLQQSGQIINYDLPWNPMRIVQRHGRVDRIGSLHKEVDLGLFFPDQRLDEMLHLEETLNRKLAQAEAAVGTGEVLPGRRSSSEVILTDDDVAAQMEALLASRGSSAALSGEEYRRRLFKALDQDAIFKQGTIELPYGVGSGFENPQIAGNGYVFCVKIGESGKPWFRYVSVDSCWDPQAVDNEPSVSSDTLSCLVAADPNDENALRVMTEAMYEKAFFAWEIARQNVFDAWRKLTDENNLLPDIPLAFRDADALVVSNGTFLGRDKQRELHARLNSVPQVKVKNAVRAILNKQDLTDEKKINAIIEELDAAGIQAPPKHEPLPRISIDEVRLVAWMAVVGTADKEQSS